MSRLLLSPAVTLALALGAAALVAAPVPGQDLLQPGDAVGVFYVSKVAGAEDDGVEPGEDLCYRCRYGSSPMVMVFARDTDGKVGDLIEQIEQAVLVHEGSSLRGLVTLIGDDASALKQEAEKLAQQTAVKEVPITVAKEHKTGPLNYKVPSDVAVTIVLALDSQVVNTHYFAADKIDIAAVMEDVRRMLN